MKLHNSRRMGGKTSCIVVLLLAGLSRTTLGHDADADKFTCRDSNNRGSCNNVHEASAGHAVANVAAIPGADWLFDTSGFVPRWECGHWPDALGWLHIVSDLLIWMAYLTIPCLLVYFTRKRPDIPFKSVFILFGAFIVACGMTHFIEALIFWTPIYRLSGVMKLITACVSLATVVALIPIIPKALAFRSPRETEQEVDRRTERLQATLRQLSLVIEAAPTGMLMIDGQGKIVLANPRIEEMFGYEREELVGRDVEVLLPERYRETHIAMRRTFAANPSTREMGAGRELYGRRKDASELPIEIGLNPIDVNGDVFVVASVVDVTLRRRFERRLETVVESAPLAIVMIDEAGRIVLSNQETERLFGYERDELLGQPVELLVPERYRAAHPANRRVFFAAPETRRMGADRELYGRRKQGEEFPVEIGLNPLEMDDGKYVLSAIVDTTERMQSKRRLEQYMADLVRSNKELEQFAYVASHDLQEPLRKVASCCQVLAEDYGPELDDKAREWIGFAVDGAQRMRQLVSDLLAYSRVGTRGKPAQPTDSAEAYQIAIANLSEAIEEASAILRCGELPWVMADVTQLSQLFQNLIGNAIKYRGPMPPVVEIGAESDVSGGGTKVRFFVRDNGMGIEPQFHERIFEIFQRLHTKEQYSGTGIGLAICKKIVLRLGGEIWLESSLGKGSTFYFTLPVAAAVGSELTRWPSQAAKPIQPTRATHATDRNSAC